MDEALTSTEDSKRHDLLLLALDKLKEAEQLVIFWFLLIIETFEGCNILWKQLIPGKVFSSAWLTKYI